MSEQTRLIGRMVAIEAEATDAAAQDAAFVTASTLRRTGPLGEIDSADNGDHIP
jgi:hypothetical protein